jgi:hypothetical protein
LDVWRSGSLAIETSSVNWAQLSRYHLKTETESSLRNVMCVVNKNRTMDNAQTHDIFINIPLSQTFRSKLARYFASPHVGDLMQFIVEYPAREYLVGHRVWAEPIHVK